MAVIAAALAKMQPATSTANDVHVNNAADDDDDAPNHVSLQSSHETRRVNQVEELPSKTTIPTVAVRASFDLDDTASEAGSYYSIGEMRCAASSASGRSTLAYADVGRSTDSLVGPIEGGK